MKHLIQFYLLLSILVNCQDENPQIDINHKLQVKDIYEILLFMLVGFIVGMITMALCCCCYQKNRANNNANSYQSIS